MPINPTSHTASQADGTTKLQACGEIHITLSRGDKQFKLQAVVVKHLDSDILAGMPFLKENGIVLDIPRDTLWFGKEPVKYILSESPASSSQIRRSHSYLLRATNKAVIHPGEYIELPTPAGIPKDAEIAMEPRCDSHITFWPTPSITQSVAGTIRIPNTSSEPVFVHRHQHLARIRFTCIQDTCEQDTDDTINTSVNSVTSSDSQSTAGSLVVDPNRQLCYQEHMLFQKLHQEYAEVFDSKIGKYNDASGKILVQLSHLRKRAVNPFIHVRT